MKTKTFLFFLSLIITTFSFSQSASDRAKAYYIEAEKSFELKDYKKTLKYLDKTEEFLGSTNSRILALRVKSYYNLEDYYKARNALNQFSGYKSSEALKNEILGYIIKVDEAIEEIERKELQRQKKEQEKRLAAQKLQNKKNSIAAAILPQVKEIMYDFNSLEEGRAYLITYRKSLTSSTDEKAYFIFHGDKFIIYTIPNKSVFEKLNKSSIDFDGYDANRGNDYVISAKLKPAYGDKRITYFKKGVHFSNVFIGGFGDEIMWTSGTQNNEFDKTLYYYFYYNTIHCDVKLKNTFQEHYYNPYIETGTLNKTVDYDLINDADTERMLRNKGFKNKKSSSLDKPNLPKIELVTSNNMKMIFPQKKVRYKFQDKVKNEYYANGTEYKGTYLYYRPMTSTSHYGFVQVSKYYPGKDIFDAITGTTNSYVLSSSNFESIYSSFSEDIGNGESRYFTSESYKLAYWAASNLIGGTRVTLESLYGTYVPEQINSDGKNTDENSDEAFMIVEEMPSFPGGESAMIYYLQENLVYPQESLKNGKTGKVWVSFIVDKTGEVRSVEVIKGVSNDLDNEARRLISNMPDWNPGKQKGEYVSVKQSIPISFALE